MPPSRATTPREVEELRRRSASLLLDAADALLGTGEPEPAAGGNGRGPADDEERQIIPIGGDGLAAPMVDYLIASARHPRPRVCFLPTASGDDRDYIMQFYEAFSPAKCEPSHLALFGRPSQMENPRRRLLAQDVIYVGGGNTANMLAVWRVHGIDEILRQAWESGILLCGSSAGAICWFEGGVTDSFGASLAPLADGLRLLPGSFCPHLDSEPDREAAYRRFIQGGLLPDGIGADDRVALHFRGRDLVDVVSDRRDAAAYRFAATGDGVLVRSLASRMRLLRNASVEGR